VLSFHSLEDRVVKQTFRRWSQGTPLPRRLPVDRTADYVGPAGWSAATCRRCRSCGKSAGTQCVVACVGKKPHDAPAQKTRQPPMRQHAVIWLVAAAVVYVGVALSGVWIASLGQDVRGLFVALEQNQQAQDALLAQYSRFVDRTQHAVLISKRPIRSPNNSLTMRFPEIVERVAP